MRIKIRKIECYSIFFCKFLQFDTDELYQDANYQKKKSTVWLHFWINQAETMVKCKYCDKRFQYGKQHGTSNMRKHLLSIHDIL